MSAVVAPVTHAAPAKPAWPAWPSYALHDDLLPVLTAWHRAGQRVAIATLIDVQGSSPRPLGSEMAIAADGQVAGYVSGGCVEAAVAHEAMSALRDGQPRWLDYGEGSEVLDIQLSCGGRIGVLVWPVPDLAEYLARWRNARQHRRAFHVALDRRTGSVRYPSAMHDVRPGEFLRVHRPPLRLVLVGADPALLVLVAMANQMGIEMRVLRPHGPSEPPPGLAPEHYDRRGLHDALRELQLDAGTALYSLAHDSEIDLQVACRGLESDAACIGILGSRSKRDNRLQALRALGHDDAALARLRLPAGWRMGRSSPHTIALGIIAEATQAMADLHIGISAA
ncbi:XdhC family protein [Xanthomonas vesicatoria]|uniref:XdhC family protein n=1 Tax=Xanthomonas vesicatoria TaxID=56460 RepID=UPI00073221F4|nr:XdhC family protein [Xanthomonas vesicatoria]KTF38651.1 xanthine dehydrogenase [Xanthomonas vesicatoria]MCC8556649.1 XdhC family protein [Xanthomonas vesicatoria]MCC8599694.1 XdhC family protein [Xanthomonas vesicatoria]MCC8609695.1 XdhC family protein [Xanthomonas vesicatoria]MCC8672277.1 XdhC family protein [Xanthomonas vesicatoria]